MALSGAAFGLFTIVFGIVSPAQEPHAFHNAIVAALLIVVAVPPVAILAWRPLDPGPRVVLAAIGIAALGTMALSLTLDPFTLPFVILAGVLYVLAPPDLSAVFDGRRSYRLLALSAVVAIALAAYVVEHAGLQRSDQTSEHAAFFHWVEMSFYAAALPLLGIVAATSSQASRLAGWSAGVALVMLGIASLLLGDFASALEPGIALVAIAAGAAFIVLAELPRRR